MASSPPAPMHSSLPNPKKRPSVSHSITSQSATKRPKLHPLRQTSYPVNGTTSEPYTPGGRSETGSVTNSLVSGVSRTTGGKKAGRPRKSDRQSAQLTEDDVRAGLGQDDTGSVVRGGGRGGGRGTKSVVSAPEDGDEDEDGDMDGMLGNLNEQDQVRRAEELRLEAQKVDRLVSSFNPDQDRRFNLYRASKINMNVLRRIVNQTVSQSVAKNPLLAVSTYTKFFAGEIIERAREVQTEWAAAYEKTRELDKRKAEEDLQKVDEQLRKLRAELLPSPATAHEIRRVTKRKNELSAKVKDYQPNPHRGGLLPDHLREAVRRYKGDGEGGGVGFGSLSHGLVGTHGAGAWRVGQGNGGRRLFR